MANNLPYMNSTGLITTILNKIIEAQTPPKYNQDFQSTKLGYGSGSALPFIPLMKRIGFLSSDGTPTDLYKQFRNTSTRGVAMAQGIKQGYSALYSINEYAHDLDAKPLKDAIIQVTGQASESSTVKAILGTFNALKAFADFEKNIEILAPKEKHEDTAKKNTVPEVTNANDSSSDRKINLSYTINLNLPETKDPEVFDAIFESLKSKLLV